PQLILQTAHAVRCVGPPPLRLRKPLLSWLAPLRFPRVGRRRRPKVVANSRRPQLVDPNRSRADSRHFLRCLNVVELDRVLQPRCARVAMSQTGDSSGVQWSLPDSPTAWTSLRVRRHQGRATNGTLP